MNVETSPGAVYGRLLAAFAALAAGAAAVVVAVVCLHRLAPLGASAKVSTSAATTVAPRASSTGFPAPPAGAVVLAGQAGEDAVGLAVTPGQGRIGLQASVVGYPKGISGGIAGLSVSFAVVGSDGASQTADAIVCGKGCYSATAAIAKPAQVTVLLAGHSPPRVVFSLPADWPPPPAGAIVTRAARVWLGLKTLTFHDNLSAGGPTVRSVWKIVAPDRLEYTVSQGGSSVIIGDHRWDKPSGPGKWQETPQAPVQQPQPFWVGATDAHVLGTVMVAGRPAWRVSFYDPGTPGWFTILVDKATMHTVDIRMTAVAHFMHDTYGSFDAPLSITPPR